ncbi:MAG: hypothetical protein DI584_00385 [Stenotrophomonas sp.]|jgi:hypothetical protein|nr:MAG: hypothetical protein DI584_00385 [Stenotrophomonas sp.]
MRSAQPIQLRRPNLYMLVYPVRAEDQSPKPVICLTDWPEIATSSATHMEKILGSALRSEIRRRFHAGMPVPLPRTKPRKGVNINLSAGESLKVLVHNEMVRSRVTHEALARSLSIPTPSLKRALDLQQPADVDLLSSMVAAIGKRLVAYIS